MADGNLVHQPKNAEGAVVFGPTVYDVPLLPYERELIKTIGITEEEYKKFTAEVRRRGAVRPAEYAHIPDIRNDGGLTAALVSIAVSLVLTGVAYLLTPKPKMPGAQKREGGVVEFGDTTGASRFTPSRGFETLAELADYASPIPIIFGRYDTREEVGGMLVSPKLIWSRMFSHGTYQRAQLLFVVGEQGLNNGIGIPDLSGIFLGNNALDSIYNDYFAFYWKRNSKNNNRIRAGNIQYGTRGKPDSGDPETGGNGNDAEVFICPALGGEREIAFCQAYSPSNSTEFGVYNAIANGTGYRVNYDIISIPTGKGEITPAQRSQALSRLKIVGDENYFRSKANGGQGESGHIGEDDHIKSIMNDNQKGIGRNYSPRMGITSITRTNGAVRNSGSDLRKTIDNVSVGDKATFVISASSIQKTYYQYEGKGESVDDINSAVESLQLSADDAMRLGEQFEIGGCIWKVSSRKLRRFEPSGKDQIIELTCIDNQHSFRKAIGVVHPTKAVKPSDEYIGDSIEGSKTPQNIGEAFYPITKTAIAVVRNNRRAVVTEIGIKSTVYQSLKGLCSFNSLITPDEIEDFDEEYIQVRTGRITAYIARSTIFRVFVRKAGDADGKYDLIPIYFAIRGYRPVAQYTFIRFKNDSLGAEELEFKFVQMSGSELRDLRGDTIVRDISQPEGTNLDNLQSIPVTLPRLGQMTVTVPGSQLKKEDIVANKEFFRNPREISGSIEDEFPASVVRQENRPAVESGNVAIGALTKGPNIANDGITKGKTGAFLFDLAGDADDPKYSMWGTYRFNTTEYVTSALKPTEDNEAYKKWIYLRWWLQKVPLNLDYVSSSDQQWTWSLEKVEVQFSGPGFSPGEVIQIKRGAQATNVLSGQTDYPISNPFVKNHPDGTLRWSGMKFTVWSTEFESVIVGRAQGYRYVLFGDARSYALDEKKTITRVLTDTTGGVTKTIKLRLTAKSKRLSDNYQLQINRGWSEPAIEVVYDGVTTSNWEAGEQFRDLVNINSSNPYRTVYNRAGVDYKVGDLKTVITETPATFTGDAVFAQQTQLSDISHYRDFVEKSNDGSPEHQIVYVNEIQENAEVPVMNDLTLAGLSLKAGRNFTQLDQMRCWLASGIQVERLHPDREKAYEGAGRFGASNMFTDLVYFLLTDQMAGAGGLLSMDDANAPLVDKDELIETSKFLYKNRLFFNGSIVERTNLRQFIADLAPYFLCNFVITDGKFSLKPAFPVGGLGGFNQGAVPVEQIFTEGNILEDTFKLEYLGAEERRAFQAVVRFRQERPNRLPEEKAVNVKGASGGYSTPGVELLPQEQFDLTQFCTSEDHAILVAKYFLSLRKLVTHTISFSTTVDGLNIRAGSFIKVATQASPYSSARNGTISSTGAVTSLAEIIDGQYRVNYYKTDDDNDIEEGVMTVSNNTVADSTFHNSVFSLIDDRISQNVYVVEQLTFSQEGTVDIVASEHPCFDDGRSKLVDAILNDSFKVF
jgi:hypothetical protein